MRSGKTELHPYHRFGFYPSGTDAYPLALSYPGKLGGYPRVYVSVGKHASYGSIDECNDGGTFGSDTCIGVNAGVRVAAGTTLNIGSRAVHAASQDCMASSNPSYLYYGAGRTECYWTDKRFQGWIPDSVGGDNSDSYSPKLSTWGF